jgi:hypothetical protein
MLAEAGMPWTAKQKKEARRASHHEFISATGDCGKAEGET